MKQSLLFYLFLLVAIPVYSQWIQTSVPTGYRISSILSYQDTLYAAMGGAVFSTTDQGDNWAYRTANASLFGHTLFANTGGLFAGTLQDGVYRSKDFGGTWEKLDNGIPNIDINAVIGRESLLFAIAYDQIYKSTDNGDSWRSTTFKSRLSGTAYSFDGMVMDSVVIVTGSGGVYRSVDQGTHWDAIPIDGLDFTSIAKLGNELFVADTGRGVFRSEDGGLNWRKISAGLGSTNIHSLFALPGEKLIAAANDNLYLYDEAEANWAALFPDEEPFRAVALSFYQNLLFVGTSSKGIWKRDVSHLISANSELDTGECSVSLYPNPAHNEITLINTCSQPFEEVYIISLNGTAKRLFRARDLPLGMTYTFDIQNLPKGFYFCIIRQQGRMLSTPFIKN